MTVTWEFVHLQLKSVNAEINKLSPSIPLDLSSKIRPTVTFLSDNHVLFEMVYDLTASDRNSRLTWEAGISFAVIYRASEPEPSTKDLDDHAPEVCRMTEPYLREYVHNLTLTMGLPPLIIDLPSTLTVAATSRQGS